MMRFFVVLVAVFAIVAPGVRAQSADQVVWVQIEAQPNLQGGLNRAEAYARDLADVNGFSLGNGWYGVVLGPYAPADAEQVLQVYRNDGLIPRDSYIVASASFDEQFFPVGADLLRRNALRVDPLTQPQESIAQPAPAQESPAISPDGLDGDAQQPPQAPDETPAEARRSERDLSPVERRTLQTALQWAGFYNSTIDGAFGRGTRNAMASWQRAKGFEPTGILTTLERAALLRDYNSVLEGLDLRIVTDTQTGIEMKIPTAVVALDQYEAPFARLNATDGTDAQVLLISQEGNVNTLASLYEVMQTLEIVPLEGPRTLSRTEFSLVGRNTRIISETRASLSGDQIKGFTLIWPTGDEDRRTRLLAEMEASFTRLPGVLDPSAGVDAQQQVDLVAGLQVRKPRISRSGFFVDAAGSVVTTADAVQSCTRITLNDEFDAQVSGLDNGLGIAVLKPSTSLAPSQVARFNAQPPRINSDVAVSGYSYEGVLDAPTMTFGTLSDVRGLRGEEDLNRLALASLPGDAGGPVFDNTGNVLGMLLPRGGGERQLPQDVSFALAGSAITQVMQEAGLTPDNGNGLNEIGSVDLAQRGLAMTVLVSCWE